MSEYVSNASLGEIVQRLESASRVLVTTHAKPDGDAYGSAVGLGLGLRAMGADPRVVFMPPVPDSFIDLAGGELTETFTTHDALPDDRDLVVIVDTGAWTQVAPMRAWLAPRLDRTLVLDHHLMGDVEAAWRYIDTEAASCSTVIAQVLDALHEHGRAPAGLVDQPDIAECLFVGLASDTGWFRHSNTRPATHELAARLLRAGVDQARLYGALEQSQRPEKLKLIERALHSLTFFADGQAAMMVLRDADFHFAGARIDETEGLVDLPRQVAGVEVVALVCESPPGEDGARQAVRVSLRSKAGPRAVNVAHVAQDLGGGGHARAAGIKIEATIDAAAIKVRDAVEAAVLAAADSM